MNHNPQSNLGAEFNKPTNEIAGIIQAHEFMMHNAVASTARALWPVVDQEMKRMMQENTSKPVSVAPEVATVAPSNTNVLGQAALREQQAAGSDEVNLLTESTDPDDLEAQQLSAIAQIHAEIEAERLSKGEADLAA